VLLGWIILALVTGIFELYRFSITKQKRSNFKGGVSSIAPPLGAAPEEFAEVSTMFEPSRGQSYTIACLGMILARKRRGESFSAAKWCVEKQKWHSISISTTGKTLQQLSQDVDGALGNGCQTFGDSEVDFLWHDGLGSEAAQVSHKLQAPLRLVISHGQNQIPMAPKKSNASVKSSDPLRSEVCSADVNDDEPSCAKLYLKGANAKTVSAALRCALESSHEERADNISLASETDLKQLLSYGKAPRCNECPYTVFSQGAPREDFSVHKVVHEIALSRRSNMAILGSESLTYDELFGWAAQICNDITYRLESSKCEVHFADDLTDDSTDTGSSISRVRKCVALLLPRGAALIASMLGAMKAGTCYVPLDVHAPAERWRTILLDCGASIVIVNKVIDDALPADIMTISRPQANLGIDAWRDIEEDLVDTSLDADNIAAVYYTSGSSGRPKGVQVSQRYITYLAASLVSSREIHTGTVVAMYHSPTWMTCLDNVFSTLFAGGAIAIFPPADSHKLDFEIMHEFLKTTGTTRISAVPVVADTLLANFTDLSSLETVGVGGAAFPYATARRLLDNAPNGCCICTAYAGTEYGDANFMKLDRSRLALLEQRCSSGFVPGGTVHGWQSVFIVESSVSLEKFHDRKLLLCNEGFVGEIAISGPGLSSGYLNKAELNARCFVSNPFVPEETGDTLFLSGDLGVWESGSIRILGRVDNQVKVNGLRIELGEIEGVLAEVPEVRNVAVVVWNNTLVAYLEPASLITDQLKSKCEEILPAYMVPKAFVCLDALPTLPNGKINRKELPEPEANKSDVVEEMDSLGMIRRFHVRTLAEDRILDNIRSFLLCMVVVSHSAGGATAAAWDVIESWAKPWQQGVIIASAGGGWLALSLASGFDDARSLKPYAFQVREPLFIFLWFVGQRHWTFWFFPAFVFVRSLTIISHRLRFERLMLFVWALLWLCMPLFLQMQPVPLPSGANPVDTGPCLAIYDAEWFKTLMEWCLGDTAIRQGLSRTFLFAPCYWLGFYKGKEAMNKICTITKLARKRRYQILMSLLVAYFGIGFTWGFGVELLESRYLLVPWANFAKFQQSVAAYDDLCSSFYAKGIYWMPLRLLLNWGHLAVTAFLSFLYVIIVALAPLPHLKTMAKTSFPALIVHGFVPCLLNIQGYCVKVLSMFGAGFHTEVIQLIIWFGVPCLFVWIVGQLLFHLMKALAIKLRQVINWGTKRKHANQDKHIRTKMQL
jgi:non-ribosomal peptide synthetase component F